MIKYIPLKPTVQIKSMSPEYIELTFEDNPKSTVRLNRIYQGEEIWKLKFSGVFVDEDYARLYNLC